LPVNVRSAPATPSPVAQLITRPPITPPAASPGSTVGRPCPGGASCTGGVAATAPRGAAGAITGAVGAVGALATGGDPRRDSANHTPPSTASSTSNTSAIDVEVLVFTVAPRNGRKARCQRGEVSSRAARSRARPVLSRQRTVPAGTPSSRASSAAERPSK
jgi:hypothetical protein